VITHDEAHELEEYEPQGGGGTDFEVNWTFMEENQIQPKKFIMFTDGYPCGSWGDEDFCDTIFIVKGNTQANAPFGQTVIYETETATA
jgi:predicted metal-dependent peptidase